MFKLSNSKKGSSARNKGQKILTEEDIRNPSPDFPPTDYDLELEERIAEAESVSPEVIFESTLSPEYRAGSYIMPKEILSAEPAQRVLLATPYPADYSVVKKKLQEQGYVVATIEDGNIVLSVLEKESFGIVCLETAINYAVAMDNGTLEGIHLVKDIRREQPAQPIMLMTTHDLDSDFYALFGLKTKDVCSYPNFFERYNPIRVFRKFLSVDTAKFLSEFEDFREDPDKPQDYDKFA